MENNFSLKIKEEQEDEYGFDEVIYLFIIGGFTSILDLMYHLHHIIIIIQ